MKKSTAEKPIRILLVDDHQLTLWGLNKLIQGERPRMEVVGQASNRAETLACARDLHPDLILLDIDLDGHNSLDFLPQLLAEVKTRVLILTGVRASETHDLAIVRGARGVVLKNEPATMIIKAIEKVHQGELWLDRTATGRVFRGLTGHQEEKATDLEGAKIDALTRREREIIRAVVLHSSLTNKKIAQKLNMSEHTMRNHLSSIYSKLGVISRLELFMYALNHHLGQASA